MLDKLSLLLKSKIALAAVGATLVAGGGASVAAAATGAHVPVVSQALHVATGTHDATDDKGQDAAGHDANDDHGHDGATATPGAGHDANDDNGQDANDNDANDANGQDANDNDADDANEFEATGSVVSVDASGSSFMLKQSDGSTVQVTASSTTIFDGGLTMLGDLKAGMTVEVKGAKQSDGSVAASRVHGEDANADQGDDHSGSSGSSGSGSGGSGSGGSGSGSSGGSGSGGSDDGHGGNG